MIIGEVKEGRAVLNRGARNTGVLRALVTLEKALREGAEP